MLELSIKDFKTIRINMLKDIVEKVDEHMGTFLRRIRKYSKESNESAKNCKIDMKKSFDWLISRMNITEERFSKNESRSVEIIQTETKYTHTKKE